MDRFQDGNARRTPPHAPAPPVRTQRPPPPPAPQRMQAPRVCLKSEARQMQMQTGANTARVASLAAPARPDANLPTRAPTRRRSPPAATSPPPPAPDAWLPPEPRACVHTAAAAHMARHTRSARGAVCRPPPRCRRRAELSLSLSLSLSRHSIRVRVKIMGSIIIRAD
jgi:hypothetical protein